MRGLLMPSGQIAALIDAIYATGDGSAIRTYAIAAPISDLSQRKGQIDHSFGQMAVVDICTALTSDPSD